MIRLIISSFQEFHLGICIKMSNFKKYPPGAVTTPTSKYVSEGHSIFPLLSEKLRLKHPGEYNSLRKTTSYIMEVDCRHWICYFFPATHVHDFRFNTLHSLYDYNNDL